MLPPTKPAKNEIEVTLLGPGYGESIVLHYGGSWIIIDSCKYLNKGPAAARYLESIGVPLSEVQQVACTHWHDDHCGGLSELYSLTPNADLVISAALQQKEFFQLVSIFSQENNDDTSSGLKEIEKTFRLVKSRGKRPIFARSDQLIWRSTDSNSELHSLSPCDQMLSESFISIGKMLPNNWDPKRPIIAKDNHVSVAMLFKAGSHSILLGSDLEESGKNTRGWSTIISGNRRPQIKSSLYKVAHHGSETGEHPGIWSQLLHAQPVSLVTPFSKLRHPLPRIDDLNRIRGNSGMAFLTTDVATKRLKRYGPVAKLAAPHNLQILHPKIGAVRCRILADDPSDTWKVEKSSEAIVI